MKKQFLLFLVAIISGLQAMALSTTNNADPSKPAPVAYFPANGVDNIPINSQLYVVFDKDITVNENNVTIDNGGTIDGVVASNDTLYISATLVKATTYTITVGANTVKDANNNMQEESSWSFTTDSNSPVVVSREPEGSTAPIKPIKLVFNETIQKVSGPVIKVNDGPVGYTLNDNTITLKDTVPTALRTYTVEIPKEAITDMSGNELAADIEWTFTTEDDAIVFPYLPVLDENYIAPSWMSGKAYSPIQAIRGCTSYKSTTGVFNTGTMNQANLANGTAYVIMDLPKCGVIKFRSSYTSKRASTIIKVVDGVETILMERTWEGANTCNYDSCDVNEFGPVTVKISASTTSGSGDIYDLEIYAPTNTIAFTWDGATTAKSFTMAATSGKTFTVDWGNGITEDKTGSGSEMTITQASAYDDTNPYTVTLSSTDPDCSFTHLDMSNKSLTSLDVSKTAALVLNCDNSQLSLSQLYSVSTKISDLTKKKLGTQTMPTQTITMNSAVVITTDTELGGQTTIYAVKQDASAAPTADYTLDGNKITFKKAGTYTVEASNPAIVSHTDYPAKVVYTYEVTSDPDPDSNPDPVIHFHTLALTTGTGIVIDKDKKSFQVQSGNPFSFVITLAEGYEGMTPTVTVNNRTKGLISIGTDKWRCILSEIYEDTDVLVSLNLTGNDAPDAPQLYARGGQLFIDTPTETLLRIYNIAAQLVANRRLTPGLTTIPLPTGIYIVQLDEMTKQVVVSNK